MSEWHFKAWDLLRFQVCAPIHCWIPVAWSRLRPQETSKGGKFPLNWRPATVLGYNGFTNIFKRRTHL